MFRQSLNRALLRLRVETVSPLLIQAGDSGLDPTAANISCVRTVHGRHGRTVYIPGASFKGVIRSAIEAWLRSASLAAGLAGACDPLDHQRSCGARCRPAQGAERDTARVHGGHCLACRLFGSTTLHGRAAVRDLYPFRSGVDLPVDLREADEANLARANRTEIRHGVAINRITGAVQNGPFETDVVPAGVTFHGEIVLENYQTWQLGLVALGLEELNGGFAQLGSGKSRGLGVVHVAVDTLVHEQPLRAPAAPLAVGALLGNDERRRYGLVDEAALPAAEGEPRGLVRRFVVDGVAAWLDAGLAGLRTLERP